MMVARTNAERQHCYIARLKALAAAEARIQELGRHNGEADENKLFTSWKSDKAKSTPTLDDLRERMAALLRDLPKDS
jgi:hypothetical protein